MKKLRLILGDQLNSTHSWFNTIDDNTTYLMAEMRQETDYVKHHIQKVVGFFLSMRNFKEDLAAKGHQFLYFKISDDNNPHKLEEIIKQAIENCGAEKLEYQLPDEYRLDEQLKKICSDLDIETEALDTEHFFTKREELTDFFKGKKQLIMENFYRMMRKKHDIMMVNGQPDGGKWNFDHNNRKKWTGSPEIPDERRFQKDVTSIIEVLQRAIGPFWRLPRRYAHPRKVFVPLQT